jgi:16S rRNA (cytidine1402-2'-O)-methyltransferase
MPATLFVVATPIGNLEDITLRAISILKQVTLIAAEDTRRTGTLLRHFGIGTPTTSYHAHNERRKLPELLRKLAEGQNLALVSDAGTPVIADPGQRLVAAAVAHGIRVVPIPGASAVMAALAASGLPLEAFVFLGFAPSRSNDRKKWFADVAAELKPVVFFEAPHRIKSALVSLSQVLVNRPILVCRELTKVHEEIVRLSPTDAASFEVTEKGEFTLVIGEASPIISSEKAVDSDIYQYFCQLTNQAELGRRAALIQTARNFGLSTKLVYAAVERLKHMSSS